MCQFFSCISDGKGQLCYCNWKQRQEILKTGECDGKTHIVPDSHTSIAYLYGVDEDKFNKYEYDPLTKKFKVDQINNKNDDSGTVERKLKQLDFSTVVHPLVLQEIYDPFKDGAEYCKKDIELLKQWASVGASIRASVGASIRASVLSSVGASVLSSVGASIRASVWDSVGAYISSFFSLKKWKHVKHRKGKNPFQPCVDLWMKGLVPCTDGEFWYLVSKSGIQWKGTIKDGKAIKV